ncbi:hypothetical protein BXZ70DRAFT_274870 [Cristinia sonorae]|uniref:Uncharacterized protein n=1 Tax=Cristinia sonorae TaxID=1940300 RepID=A0A8K0UYJ3_9AGAR|nr:hypothetical protein BXZ70DRAFT_274870 [Cristinia sonorae]
MSRPRTDRLRYYTWYTKNNKRNSSPNPSPNLMFPKVVAFETSGVLFSGDLRKDVWGKGPGASKTLANNVEQVSERVLRDKSNSQNTVELYEDIPRIIHHVLQSGAALAIVSRTQSKDLSDRVLYFFHAIDPKTNVGKPIIKMVKYDEVVDEPKIKHFGRIQGWHKCTYKDIVGGQLLSLFEDN